MKAPVVPDVQPQPFPFIRNRRIAAQAPEYLASAPAELADHWLVSDRYSDGSPRSYASECSDLEVVCYRVGKWVICTKRGNFLRYKRLRIFRTPLAAAKAAEAEDQT